MMDIKTECLHHITHV